MSGEGVTLSVFIFNKIFIANFRGRVVCFFVNKFFYMIYSHLLWLLDIVNSVSDKRGVVGLF